LKKRLGEGRAKSQRGSVRGSSRDKSLMRRKGESFEGKGAGGKGGPEGGSLIIKYCFDTGKRDLEGERRREGKKNIIYNKNRRLYEKKNITRQKKNLLEGK